MTTNNHGKSTLLESLSHELVIGIKALNEYFEQAGHRHPSFELGAPTTVVPEEAPQDVHITRESVMDQALQIFQLLAGPSEYLANLQTGVYHPFLSFSYTHIS